MTDSELRLEALRMAITQHCEIHDAVGVAEVYYAFLSKEQGAPSGPNFYMSDGGAENAND